MPDNLKLKEENDRYLTEANLATHDANPDKKGYRTIEELELGETRLKYSLRRYVAGFLTLCAALVLIVFVWHILAPKEWRWLPDAEIASLKSLALTLFGALAMSIATLFYTKR